MIEMRALGYVETAAMIKVANWLEADPDRLAFVICSALVAALIVAAARLIESLK